ncbi:hypothetical protein HK44_023820 [Pseudomonas fluorescens HK44]|uniref:Uncharacterized protein n=1 Tax=Pseudomonas fluorescens HK44 TaxID=1042209 RepID=A0A010S4R4_PSEFL|nr:hypothetical protein [Pseudomonas fluorescens]EXF95629.1 hypothetical protein HK44_023820 [Pseudomonas fluorescens HK44]
MFRLNEALRNRRAQGKNTQQLQLVATAVATLSPRAKPDATGLVAGVAGVAAVAKNRENGSLIGDLIERLHKEGAELFCLNNRLCFRLSEWDQLDLVNRHWRELLAYLRQHEKEIQDGPGRQA